MKQLKRVVKQLPGAFQGNKMKTFGNILFLTGFFSMGLFMKSLIIGAHKPQNEYSYKDYVKSFNSQDIEWLARNIYHEARGESWEGMLAVGVVTLNRVASPHYPDTIEGVVKDYKQFSWYWDGMPDTIRDRRAWKKAKAAAAAVLFNSDLSIAETLKDAKHYHAVYVDPYWADTKNQITTIGKHTFYL